MRNFHIPINLDLDNDNDNTLFKRRKIKNKIVKVSLERGYSRG